MSDILPVRMQDFLHRRKPELRAQISSGGNQRMIHRAVCQKHAAFMCSQKVYSAGT